MNKKKILCKLPLDKLHFLSSACLKDPTLLPCHQTMLRFYNKIAYDTEYDGYGNNAEEGERLGCKLGKDKDVIVLGNHGLVAVGETAAYAFDCMYFIEKVAMFQVGASCMMRKMFIWTEQVR